ncbi:MAG TPA: biotin/lipoyl-binding protein, partial [Candidatus Paceibacterota bacterium]|nr:biotin/lipoyl-binding protein [Candidatus Paceibacterota bacterium]
MNKKIIYAVVALVVVVLGYLYFSSGGNGSYEYVTIEKRDIVQEVSVTGKVKPVSSAMLAFDRLGKVVRFNVDVGNHVSAGDVLASLDSSELAANLLQAEASVRVQEAKLDELKRGARTEDLEVSYAERDSATTALVDAKKGLVEKINDAYTKSDDAIRNRVDRMFTNPRSANPELVFIVADATLSDQIKAERVILEGVLNNWNSSLGSLSSGADLGKYVSKAYANLEKIKSFLDKMALAVSGLTTNATLTQTTLDTYKSETATSRTNINSAISALVAADEKMRAADSALRVAS